MSETRQKAGLGSRGADSPRRRWSEAEKRRIVAESLRGAESATAVARRHGVHTSVLFRWRRRYRTAADTGAGFVPVVVEAPEPGGEAASGRMEIVLGEDVRVIVDATVHAGALARVVAVVAGR
jgi:transposase